MTPQTIEQRLYAFMKSAVELSEKTLHAIDQEGASLDHYYQSMPRDDDTRADEVTYQLFASFTERGIAIVPVASIDDDTTILGNYNTTRRDVQYRTDMGAKQRAYVLSHEFIHTIDPRLPMGFNFFDMLFGKTAQLKDATEIETEAAAFLLAQDLGLESKVLDMYRLAVGIRLYNQQVRYGTLEDVSRDMIIDLYARALAELKEDRHRGVSTEGNPHTTDDRSGAGDTAAVA